MQRDGRLTQTVTRHSFRVVIREEVEVGPKSLGVRQKWTGYTGLPA